MSHTYLLDLYQVLAKKRKQHIRETAGVASPEAELRMRGRLDALTDFSKFLKGYHSSCRVGCRNSNPCGITSHTAAQFT